MSGGVLAVVSASHPRHSTAAGWVALGVCVVLGWFLLRRAKRASVARAQARAKAIASAVQEGFAAAVASAAAAAESHADGGSVYVQFGDRVGGYDRQHDYDHVGLRPQLVELRPGDDLYDAVRSLSSRGVHDRSVGAVSDSARHGGSAGRGSDGPVAARVPVGGRAEHGLLARSLRTGEWQA